MAVALFTYGSLMFPQVWEKVAQTRYAQTPGVVYGYERYSVRDASYPGMIAQSGARVEGVLYFDVSDADLVLLDAFEGDAYQRRRVLVERADGQQVEAQTYLFLDRQALSPHVWAPERFAMHAFLNRYCA